MKKFSLNSLRFLAVIVFGLTLGATVSLAFHSSVFDSISFFGFGLWIFVTHALLFSVVVFAVSFLIIQSIQDLKIAFVLAIFGQLLGLELIQIFPDEIGYLLMYLSISFGIVTLNCIWYLFKKYTCKDIFWFSGILFVVVVALYIPTYINSPVTAYDICKQISDGEHEEKLLKILKENNVTEGDGRYLERRYSREKNGYFIESGLYCRVLVNGEGMVTNIEVWEDSI